MKCVLVLGLVALALVPLCDAIRPAQTYKFNLQDKNDDVNACQSCKSFLSFISHLNSMENRTEYKEALYDFCELYYPATSGLKNGPCTFLVETFYFVIDQIDSVHHCDQIGACGDADSMVNDQLTTQAELESMLRSPTALDREGDVVCQTCQSIVQNAKDAALDPNNRKALKKTVSQFCSFLRPIAEDGYCRKMILDNLENVLDYMAKLDPKTYCKSISLCQNYRSSPVAHLPTLADFRGFGLETSVTYGKAAESKPETRVHAPNCVLCKTVVKEMFKFLHDNRTEDNIRDGLDKVCGYIYHDAGKREECQGMVKAYTKELIDLLTEETDPQMVCILLEQCAYPKDKAVEYTFGDFIASSHPDTEVDSVKTCIECKFVIKYLHNSIDDSKTEDSIKEWLLDNVCANIQDSAMKKECVDYINKYSKVFLEAMVKELDPQKTCADLGVCKPKSQVLVVDLKQSKPRPKTQNQRKDGVCEQCVNIITKIDEYLSTSLNTDVSTIIDQVCNKLPSDPLRNQCTILVKTMGTQIAQEIATMDNPRQLCSKFMLCAQ